MEIKDYIASGILELYVLGDLSEQERDDVMLMAAKYPEVAAELRVLELGLESILMQTGKQPQTDLRAKVISSVMYNDSAETPAVSVIPMHSNKIYAYALAACFTLLIGAGLGMYNFWSKWQFAEKQVVALQDENRAVIERLNFVQTNFTQSLQILRTPTFTKYMLKGTEKFPGMQAVLHWNTSDKSVMLDLVQLPNNDLQHQYQLWAIVDGVPVDAGVFDMSKDGTTAMIKLKDVQKAQAFGVTLEPRGGSKSPTLEKLYLFAQI